MNDIVILIQHLMILKMVVISSFLLVHHRRKPVRIEGDLILLYSCCLESGLVLTASTVVLTDERISHVGDPNAVATSCSQVELVDISSNAFSDWHEVCLIIILNHSIIDSLFRYLYFFHRYPM